MHNCVLIAKSQPYCQQLSEHPVHFIELIETYFVHSTFRWQNAKMVSKKASKKRENAEVHIHNVFVGQQMGEY